MQGLFQDIMSLYHQAVEGLLEKMEGEVDPTSLSLTRPCVPILPITQATRLSDEATLYR